MTIKQKKQVQTLTQSTDHNLHGDVCITTRPALSIDMSICTLNLKRILMQVRESLISSVRAGRERGRKSERETGSSKVECISIQ